MPVGIDFRAFKARNKSKVNRGELESVWYKLLAGIYGDFNKTPAEIQQRELRRERQSAKRFRLGAEALSRLRLKPS
jgi:hypothetical protein